MPEPKGNDQPRFAMTMNHAIDLAESGNVEQAAKLLSDLLAEFSEAASVRGYLGWFLLQLGRYEEAIEQSARAIRLAPESEKASLIHFQVLWQSGKQIEALDEMKRFLTFRPSQIYTELINKWKPDLEDD